MRHNLTDNYSFADRGTNLRITGDGFLVATPRVARTGIQIYQGAEVGRPDLDNVRVFRPPHEVFARNATSSLAHSDVTLDHPPEYLNASNWKQFSVGNTGDEVVRDGEFIRIPLIIKDATAISAIKGGKAELSVGYSADLDWTAGVTADGERYDAIQRAIRGNHIAICSQARGGSQLRIGDSSMSYKANDAANQRRLADAYRAYDKALADAYREYDERISTAWQDGNDRQIPVADGVSDLSPFERREQAYRDHETCCKTRGAILCRNRETTRVLLGRSHGSVLPRPRHSTIVSRRMPSMKVASETLGVIAAGKSKRREARPLTTFTKLCGTYLRITNTWSTK